MGGYMEGVQSRHREVHNTIAWAKGCMINALSMISVAMNKDPHPSHKMGPKESTLVSCASNDRFGSIRICENCEGRDVEAGGAGSRYQDEELLSECKG